MVSTRTLWFTSSKYEYYYHELGLLYLKFVRTQIVVSVWIKLSFEVLNSCYVQGVQFVLMQLLSVKSLFKVLLHNLGWENAYMFNSNKWTNIN